MLFTSLIWPERCKVFSVCLIGKNICFAALKTVRYPLHLTRGTPSPPFALPFQLAIGLNQPRSQALSVSDVVGPLRIHTPYSKMAAILVFFCFHANWPLWPRSSLNILLNFTFESEAIRVNLHENKRILKWRPFWNKVYKFDQLQLLPENACKHKMHRKETVSVIKLEK